MDDTNKATLCDLLEDEGSTSAILRAIAEWHRNVGRPIPADDTAADLLDQLAHDIDQLDWAAG